MEWILIFQIIGFFYVIFNFYKETIQFRKKKEKELLKYIQKTFEQGDINDELSSTPKSLSSMDKIYLPQIQKDFPEFNWYEFKPIIENVIIQKLIAIDSRNAELVKEFDYIYTDVENILLKENIEHFKDIKTHDTVISNYYKKNGTCYIIAETSVEYFTYIENNNKLEKGYKDRKKQTVYETELIYIQNINDSNSTTLGITCQNCGAPITNLGAKYCEYCGSALETINKKVWEIASIKEE